MILKMRNSIAVAMFVGLMAGAPNAFADGAHVAPATEFAKAKIAAWLNDPLLISAIKAQNAKNSGLAQADVDALDKQWRAEVDAADKPLISSVLGNEVSKFLAAKKAEMPETVTEMFVMDAKGLNVGQSDVTSDYWQGDEAKWQKSYQAGADAIFVDEVEKDESTQMLQTQISLSIKDPDTNEVIGAITVGVNVDAL